MEQLEFAEQGTEAWRRERAGHASGSRIFDVMGTPKARDTYLLQLVCERLTGEPMPEVFAHSLKWGKDCEPYAKDLYQIDTGRIILDSGFVKHPSIAWLGSSPDGLVGTEGLVEIKSPHNSLVQLGTWKHGMPSEHKPQVQCNLWVTGRAWCDFISFDPRLPENLRLYVERVPRDDKYIADMEKAVTRFLAEVNLAVVEFKNKGVAA